MAECWYCKKKGGILSPLGKWKGKPVCEKCYAKLDADRNIEIAEKKKNIEVSRQDKAKERNELWEYKIVQIKTKTGMFIAYSSQIPELDMLNKLGKEGWELITVLGLQSASGAIAAVPGTTTGVAFILKRRIV